ncbi:flavodoxin [Streptomyces sp. TRM66268-LWL]|uniref:Flavodoxin n=1 Tax=Streptomyces polyasparticus TaxID=2767826 RepID=A0ABR7SPJ4_9ACTN|nr:flavodoxin domain-containing protein [Streptomyces polyasparticus]MBC9717397.1 flavodoxin [Streptomyces polyasparticus]
MTATVLIAYGTTNHSTAEIAETIAEVLRKENFTAAARPAREITQLTSYDAVVIGGALYAGRWHRDARRFVRHNRQALSRLPVWLFSSGPLDSSAAEQELPPVPGVLRILGRIDAREHATFGGRLAEGAKGPVARMILNSGRGGDFRDFARIEEWAAHIAADLQAMAAPSGQG